MSDENVERQAAHESFVQSDVGASTKAFLAYEEGWLAHARASRPREAGSIESHPSPGGGNAQVGGATERAAGIVPQAGSPIAGESCALCGGTRTSPRTVDALRPGAVIPGGSAYAVPCPAVFHTPPDPIAADSKACPASEPSATDDAVVANLRAAAEIQGRPPTWGEIRYLLAHIDGIRGYAETGEDVEGVLIKANLDDFEQTPGETVLWLIDRICSAEKALFLAVNDPYSDISGSPVGACARNHFRKYPNGIHTKGGDS